MTDAERQAICDKACVALSEHFEGVQILATFSRKNRDTALISSGSGNYYTRRGMVTEFITREDEKSRIDVRPCDDDNEGWKANEA